jgi:hypothetical protein
MFFLQMKNVESTDLEMEKYYKNLNVLLYINLWIEYGTITREIY